MAKIPDPSVQTGFPIRGWFAESHPDFRREMLALARPKSYAVGSVIYQAGHVGSEVFGISAGVVTVQCRFTRQDALLLHMLRPGEWFGVVPVLVEWRRRVTVIARTDVELLRVPGGELQALLRRHPEWVAELGREVVYYLDVAMQGAADLLIRDASARCAAGYSVNGETREPPGGGHGHRAAQCRGRVQLALDEDVAASSVRTDFGSRISHI